jgi:MscS family membrane protein
MKRFPLPPGWRWLPSAALAARGAAAEGVQVSAGEAAARGESPDFLEHLVDAALRMVGINAAGNTLTHLAVAAAMLLVALLGRRIVTALLFPTLRRLAERTATTLDDKLFPALERPAAALVTLTGIFSALRVLKLSAEADLYIGHGSQVAFSLVLFWGAWCALSAVLEHAGEVARERNLGVAAFMPWIRKTALVLFAVLGALLTIQGLGFDVKALLAGLGIGGLAFALAAQDTLANVFGAIVVAVDQPFRVGDSVRIGGNVGKVEDVGLRSTRVRLQDRSLMVIPNKTVASDTITNLSRFTGRRFEQVLGLTYSSRPEQLEAIVADIRALLLARPEVESREVHVYFREFGASSLDLWLAYELSEADFGRSLEIKQEINLAIMRAVEARGLAFAFPTRTVELSGPVVERLAGGKRD